MRADRAEAIRARLLARERVALHRSIATMLEQQYDDNVHQLDDALAYHMFEEAGAWDSARRYVPPRAADHALALCAPREALQQLERAVVATEHSGTRVDAALLIARGRAHETLGAFSHADDDFAAALAVARESGDRRAQWLALHALGMLWAARDYDRAAQHRRDALDLARSIDDPLLIAHSLNRVGNWYVNREGPAMRPAFRITRKRSRSSSASRTGAASPRPSTCSRWRTTSRACPAQRSISTNARSCSFAISGIVAG